jgi:diaminopimelate decarboxylase
MNQNEFLSRAIAHHSDLSEESPAYFFNQTALIERYEDLSALAADTGLGLLAAVKAFPDHKVLEMAHAAGLGFDVSNANEMRLIMPLIGPSTRIQLCGPAWGKRDLELLHSLNAQTVAIADNHHQYELLLKTAPKGQAGLRVELSTFLHSSQFDSNKSSRFGIDSEQIPTCVDTLASKGWSVGLQVHDGLRPHTQKTFLELAWGLIKIAHKCSNPVSFFSLGGGIHYLTQGQRETLFCTLRALFGNRPVYFEPGGYLSSECGILITDIVSWKRNEDHLTLIVGASNEAHLKWSKPRMLFPSKNGTHPIRATIYGNTCFEGDKIGEFSFVADEEFLKRFLERGICIFTNVSAYSFAWQVPFNGVPVLPLFLI